MATFIELYKHMMDNSQNIRNKIVFTGCPGAGKTSVIDYLKKVGVKSFPEAPRFIIAQQSRIENGILPQEDFSGFSQLVFKEMLLQYNQPAPEITIYDRAIPDVVAYFESRGEEPPANILRMAQTLKYAPRVVMFPPWKEIYAKDSVRYESFDEAQKIAESLVVVYRSLGYTLIDVPKTSVQERAAFIVDALQIEADE
jgi:predicted ATPase